MTNILIWPLKQLWLSAWHQTGIQAQFQHYSDRTSRKRIDIVGHSTPTLVPFVEILRCHVYLSSTYSKYKEHLKYIHPCLRARRVLSHYPQTKQSCQIFANQATNTTTLLTLCVKLLGLLLRCDVHWDLVHLVLQCLDPASNLLNRACTCLIIHLLTFLRYDEADLLRLTIKLLPAHLNVFLWGWLDLEVTWVLSIVPLQFFGVLDDL